VSTTSSAKWLCAGGEMGERIRTFAWSKTPIGPINAWSPALQMMVRFLLANRFPLLLWWGPEYISIYNDAYRPILGAKHPWGLGQPLRECWKEIWDVLRPLVDTPFKGGPATWNDDILLEINRHGFSEETHFTVAYSPVPDEAAAGGIGGVLATVHEITEKVIGERRISSLRDVAAGEKKTAEEACAVAASALAKYSRDVPFALLYVNTPDGTQTRLAGSAGVDCGGHFSPAVIQLDDDTDRDRGWPLRNTAAAKSIQIIDNLRDRFGAEPPRGPWSDAPRQAVILPIRTSVTQVAGFFIAGVSARLKLDDAYRGYYELLANQIGIAVANARAYEEERKRAEALADIDRAKTTFFSNVSHEFRTPLTLMLGPLEDTLATSAALPSVDRERLQAAQRNALRLLKLVNTLLDFSRIEARRIEASYEATDLADFTSELASVFRSTIERAGIQFLVDCQPLTEPIYVDREMWEKIVLNLVSNAFKFTLVGQIEVALQQVEKSVEFSVSDSGIGIPAEEIPHVFERFHRVKGARGRSYEGSGIGLALVQELVKLHGGTARVESQVDRGSRFTVALPLGTAHIPEDRIAAPRNLVSTAMRAGAVVEEMAQWSYKEQTEKSLPTDSPFLSHDIPAIASTDAPGNLVERILLADDNADMRQYVERLLTQSGYRVEVVADGIAALEAARKHKPDLVVTDVMMPRLDGFGLLREFRADPVLATIPIIVLSARAGEEARIEGMQAGATDYLVKPFSARELVVRVQASLRLARVRQEAESAVRKSEERLRALVAATSYVTYRMSADWSKMLELEGKGFMADTEAPSTSWFDTYIHPGDRTQVLSAIKKAISNKNMFELEHRVRRVDGTLGWTLSRAVPLLDTNGEIVEWFGAATDITERVNAESTRRMLLGELNHRVKNTLASVQAIAQQTLRRTNDPADFTARFSGRIHSLARVHALLSEATWQGADLRDLIRDQLLHGPIDETRLTAWGPAVYLQPQTALHIAVMLHELGTNSIKYGALSSPKGWVTISWTVVGDLLNLQWVERGGPVVLAPSRRGFGTMLIEQSAKSEGGLAEQIVESEGLTWKISMRLPRAAGRPMVDADETRLVTPSPSQSQAVAKPTMPFADWRFLVVEDESLIALDLVDMLENLGAEKVQAVSSEPECLAVLKRDIFDCALLDANLNGRSVENIAAALTRRKVPFIFVTGYGREGLPPGFQQAPVLAKPVTSEQLLQFVTARVSKPKKVVHLSTDDGRKR
jgi:signal transduction histidine kinase/CheY-like chemotaxis protein